MLVVSWRSEEGGSQEQEEAQRATGRAANIQPSLIGGTAAKLLACSLARTDRQCSVPKALSIEDSLAATVSMNSKLFQ